MKRWMTSLAPNRRTKFVSFTSRLLGRWPTGEGAPAGWGRGGSREPRGGPACHSCVSLRGLCIPPEGPAGPLERLLRLPGGP